MWQELKKLGLPKEDFRFSKLTEELVLNPADPLENVRFKIRRADAEKEENINNQVFFTFFLKVLLLRSNFLQVPTAALARRKRLRLVTTLVEARSGVGGFAKLQLQTYGTI